MDHNAIAQRIEAEIDTRKKFEIWNRYYDVLLCRSRIFTRDNQGNELKRIYCGCENCKKEPQNAQHSELFQEFYNQSFDQLEMDLECENDYARKLKIWVDRFGIDYCVRFTDSDRNKELSIIPESHSLGQIQIYNKMQYRLWKEHYFGTMANSRHSSTDLSSRIKSYDEQLQKSPFKEKILEDTKSQLLEHYSKIANPSV